MPQRAIVLASLLACGSLILACSDTVGPERGTLIVDFEVTGPLPPDSWATVWVDGEVEREVTQLYEVRAWFEGLEAGSHSVELTELAPQMLADSCPVRYPNPRVVNVVAGKTTETTFTIACPPTYWSTLFVNTETGGTHPPEEYAYGIGTAGSWPVPLIYDVGPNDRKSHEFSAFWYHGQEPQVAAVKLSAPSSCEYLGTETPLAVGESIHVTKHTELVPNRSTEVVFRFECH